MRINLTVRGLKPAAVLAANRPHGDRLRYMGGCRCDECRQANTDYERSRKKARAAGDWNGIVSAGKARAHLAKLSKRNVGRRAVGDVTDISDTVLSNIISGRKRCIRARTERLILAVTTEVAANHALIPAAKTWALINELIGNGYTKAALANMLGKEMPALQLGKEQVLVRTAHAVRKLHQRLAADGYPHATRQPAYPLPKNTHSPRPGMLVYRMDDA